MAITTSLTSTIGQVRFLIGDDTDGAGVLPTGGNFSDEQVSYALAAKGNSIKAAAAELCGVLAKRWNLAPQSFSQDGLQVNRGEMVKRWLDLQATLNDEAIAAAGGLGSITLDRRDAYSVEAEQGGSDLQRDTDTTYS